MFDALADPFPPFADPVDALDALRVATQRRRRNSAAAGLACALVLAVGVLALKPSPTHAHLHVASGATPSHAPARTNTRIAPRPRPKPPAPEKTGMTTGLPHTVATPPQPTAVATTPTAIAAPAPQPKHTPAPQPNQLVWAASTPNPTTQSGSGVLLPVAIRVENPTTASISYSTLDCAVIKRVKLTGTTLVADTDASQCRSVTHTLAPHTSATMQLSVRIRTAQGRIQPGNYTLEVFGTPLAITITG